MYGQTGRRDGKIGYHLWQNNSVGPAVPDIRVRHSRTYESEGAMTRVIAATILCLIVAGNAQAGKLRAGASAVDITPTEFPVIVNGMFEERIADKALDPIFAKCIVLDDGHIKLAIVVADSCMLPRDLLDEAKNL